MPKGVKTGYMSRLRSMTEIDIQKLSKDELIDMLASVSKNITASVRKLRANEELWKVSQFAQSRDMKKDKLPREIKKSVAEKMTETKLQNELRKLAYVSRAKTYNVSGVKKMVKSFKESTGKDITSLSSEDWEKIRKAIEEGYDSTNAIAAYDSAMEDEEYKEAITKLEAKKAQEANRALDVESAFTRTRTKRK